MGAGDSSELERLTRAAANGDREALEDLLSRYQGELRAFVRLRTGPELRARESSADLVQSVCREVLENAERFRFPGETAFKDWLYTTAARKVARRLEYYRAEKRDARQDAPMREESDEERASLAASYRRYSSPSSPARRAEELERVENAFDVLTDEQREIVTLAHLVGLSRAEIGERLGKSEGAVRVALHRALATLASELSD